MGGTLSTYAFVNAKFRTRISSLLEHPQSSDQTDIQSFLESIAGYGYRDALEIYNQTGDVDLAELLVRRSIPSAYDEILRYLTGNEFDFVASLALKFEIDEIKNGLRLFTERTIHGIENSDKFRYLSNEMSIAIAGADSVDEIVSLLGPSRYGGIIDEEISRFGSGGSLYRAETSLDRYYYRTVKSEIEKLSATDRLVAERFITLEVDTENLRRYARGRVFNRDPAEIESIGAPFVDVDYAGDSIDTLLNERLNIGASVAAALTAESGGRSRGIVEKLDIIEAALDSEIEQLIERSLSGPPFTLAIVLSYAKLKEREVSRILTSMIDLRFPVA